MVEVSPFEKAIFQSSSTQVKGVTLSRVQVPGVVSGGRGPSDLLHK